MAIKQRDCNVFIFTIREYHYVERYTRIVIRQCPFYLVHGASVVGIDFLRAARRNYARRISREAF